MFTIKFHKNILCIFVHDIAQYLMKCCTSMSDITQLMFSLHHYLTAQASPARALRRVRVRARTAIAYWQYNWTSLLKDDGNVAGCPDGFGN